MIVSFRDDWLRDFFVRDVEARLFRKIRMIDDAMADRDLRVPPGNHLEKLHGNLEGFHSIPSQQTVADHVSLGSRPRRSDRCISGRP